VAAATSGKAVAAAVALGVLAVWSTSCSTPPAGPVVDNVQACFGAPPANWSAALETRKVTLPDGVSFGLGALAGETAFGEFDSASGRGIGELDLTTGKLTTITDYGPATSGLGAMAVERPWLVWEQLDSKTNMLDWSVHAWNENTGATTVLATSRLADGGYVAGQEPIPVIQHGVAAWAQPVPSTSGLVNSQIRLVDLATGRVSTVDTGRFSSPVHAGPYLIWATIGAKNEYSLRAVDAATGRPVALPDPVRDPGTVSYLAGSPDYLVWSSQDYRTMTAWQIGSPHLRRFISPDDRHHFQYLQISGHFVLWFGSVVSSVLDLTTGKAFDVQGTVTGSPDRIVAAESVGRPAAKGQFTASQVSSIATSTAPAITRCADGR
jgi:hypothetical protein